MIGTKLGTIISGVTAINANWGDDVDAHVYGDITTIASHATNAAIWAAAVTWVDWTGAATTTAFPNAANAGDVRILKCAGACSFTAGANMLIPGVASAASITLAANDVVEVLAVTTTQFLLRLFTPITTAARTVLDDATVGAMVDTLGGAAASGTGGLVRVTSAALLGTPTAPTAATSTNTTQIATTAMVQNVAMTAALPAQSGNSGKFVTTDGTNASWVIPAATAISNTPAGNIAATTVQAALDELDAEKAALAGAAFTGPVSSTSGNPNLKTNTN
ncbi:MAG: hypothetical protein ABIU85_05330, partial [Methylotenera sp.]